MLFSEVNNDSFQWTLHGAEDVLPPTIKSHMVKIVITWSISPDENNNIGLVYRAVLISLLLLLLPVECISKGHSRTVKNFKTPMKEGSLYTHLKAG